MRQLTIVCLPFESLVVLEVLPQSLQEQPELPELQEIVAMLAVTLGLVLGEMECPVNSL